MVQDTVSCTPALDPSSALDASTDNCSNSLGKNAFNTITPTYLLSRSSATIAVTAPQIPLNNRAIRDLYLTIGIKMRLLVYTAATNSLLSKV